MRDHQNGTPALSELRGRLQAGQARLRLTKVQLASRTGLSRTTVQMAFKDDEFVPSAPTVAALAHALKLPVGELLELQRIAQAQSGEADHYGSGPGCPIGEWEPHDLEVHPAGPGEAAFGSDVSGGRVMPGYVRREHDRVLARAVEDAAAGRSRIVVLVGTSSTGKTRACWEAVQPLADRGWRLWHPFDPTRAEAALEDLHRVRPRTVVWLNEAQHYLGDQGAGERIAAAVHQLLVSAERGPVLVLGTLWPEYAAWYTALPMPGTEDPHSRVRELLAGRILTVPEAFDAESLAAATALAKGGDRLLGEALSRARADGRVTQDLAGAPELLNRYQHATPAAKALLEAAMDTRRLGVGLHLPQGFLTDAAPGYLSQADYDQLTDDWAEQAYAELAGPVHGKQAPLRRTVLRPSPRPTTPSTAAGAPAQPPAGPVFRLADYLEQHGRTTRKHLCPPASFWHAASVLLTSPEDLDNLTRAAEERYRLQWAHHLRQRAADFGSTDALVHLAQLRGQAEDWEEAEALALRAAELGDTDMLVRLADHWADTGSQERAEVLAVRAAELGDASALLHMTRLQAKAEDWSGAKALALKAADHGDTSGLRHLTRLWAEAEDWEEEERSLRQAAAHRDASALVRLSTLRVTAGHQEKAESLALQAASLGNAIALVRLTELRAKAEEWEEAKTLALKAASHGNAYALVRLAAMRVKAGAPEEAQALALKAAHHGNTSALVHLAELQAEAGDQEEAERLLRQAADHGDTSALVRLATLRVKAGDRENAEALALRAAALGSTDILVRMAVRRASADDREGAQALALQAAHHGDAAALVRLAVMRAETDDQEGAQALALHAADHGDTYALVRLAELRVEAGDQDGTEHLLQLAVDRSDSNLLVRMAELQIEAGDQDRAERLLRHAADLHNTSALIRLAELREKAGAQDESETLALEAADLGNTDFLVRMAELRVEGGEQDGAERLLRHAADLHNISALIRLATMRVTAGDQERAKALILAAADLGNALALSSELRAVLERLWPYGLDPGGTPTPPWQ